MNGFDLVRLEAIRDEGGPDWQVTVDPNGRFYRLDDAQFIRDGMAAVAAAPGAPRAVPRLAKEYRRDARSRHHYSPPRPGLRRAPCRRPRRRHPGFINSARVRVADGERAIDLSVGHVFRQFQNLNCCLAFARRGECARLRVPLMASRGRRGRGGSGRGRRCGRAGRAGRVR